MTRAANEPPPEMVSDSSAEDSSAPSAASIEPLDQIRANLHAVIRGKEERIDLLLAALLAQGHVLIEDLPGLGKTTLAKALARSISSDFRRVQFTPDLLPTDVIGGSVYNASDGSFTFHQGPVFTNILLADEINRASPRTQSSLLEAMAERQVTIEGVRRELPPLFMVIATQNPIEFHGTYPLPEAQLDRFLVRLVLGYTDEVNEVAILYDQNQQHPLEALESVVERETILDLQNRVRGVHVAGDVGRYIVDIVRRTREHEQVRVGASPRGALGVFRIAQAMALMERRDHVRPEDVKAACVPVLAHRLVLDTKAQYSGVNKESVISEVLDAVKVPR